MSRSDTVIVGGGLAGLTAAARLARAGQQVDVLEGTKVLGGRGQTRDIDGFACNLGPHALYRTGSAARILASFGIHPRGGQPPTHALAADLDGLPALPFSPWTLATSPLVPGRSRWTTARALGQLTWTDPAQWTGTTVAEWLASHPPRTAAVLATIVRVSTYANLPEIADAGATIAQLVRGTKGVLYLDGGWTSLVTPLARIARDAGARIHLGARAEGVDGTTVHTTTGTFEAKRVVLCVDPGRAAALTGSADLAGIRDAAVPVRAACLDVGMRGSVDPARRFGLGVTDPIYVSLHSDHANLAPPGHSLIHAALYGDVDDETAARSTLEAAMDRMHPGWRDRVAWERFRPRLTVAHDLPRAAVGGRRAEPAIADRPGVFVAGDWVGDEGWLLDAALDSAVRVADRILGRPREAA